MSAMLAGLGFTVITAVDANKAEMERSIRDFPTEVRSTDVSLFFYSGHEMEISGENYPLPTDAKLEDESGLNFEVINSKIVTNSLGGERKVGIVLLDACRDNPFTKSLRRSLTASRSTTISVGLAEVSGGGLFVGFATSPGDTAADGDGNNSPFTTALLKWFPQKGLDIDQAMRRVKADVSTVTNNKQRPWTSSDLTTDVYMAGQ